MKLKCINTGRTVNLTIDQEYDLIRETADRYIIVNNKGIQQQYDKRLFKEVIEIVEIPVQSVDKFEIVTEYSNDFWDEDVDEGEDEMNFNVKIKLNDKEYKFDSLDILNYFTTEISCGINQISGLDALMHFVDVTIEKLEHQANEDKLIFANNITKEQIQKELFETLLQDIIEDADNNVGMLLLSTNINGRDRDEVYFDILREKADSVNEAFNPNSENTIELYTFVVNE